MRNFLLYKKRTREQFPFLSCSYIYANVPIGSHGLNLIFSVLKTFLSSSVKYFLFTYILCFITAISYFTMYLLVAIRTY